MDRIYRIRKDSLTMKIWKLMKIIH